LDQKTDDNRLIERLQKGNVEAFDLIFEKYSGNIYAFALKYLKSKDEAEELVQSVFVKVWENHKNLKKELSFKSFLFTITYNDICKIFRRRNYRQQFIDNTLYDNPKYSSETEDSINYNSTLKQLQQIIDKLPEIQRTIFLKSRQEGKSTKEIADEVGLSPGTIDNYISESLKFIRKYLRKESLPVILLWSIFFF
jgi:RNA polymerase sigma-70 factor (family 1)